MKTKVFAVRNAREILRDPLSYVFALGFPVVMLVIMTIVNGSIPAEAGMKIFSLQNLAPAVVIFMLSSCFFQRFFLQRIGAVHSCSVFMRHRFLRRSIWQAICCLCWCWDWDRPSLHTGLRKSWR